VAMAHRPTWSHTSGGRAPLVSPSEGKGVYSPGRIPLDRSRAHASPRRAGQLTSSHPIPRAGRWAARRGGVGGWKGEGDEEDKREGWLTAGPQPSARGAKKQKESRGVGPPRVICLLGRLG
jgi:hypothetical protein